MKKCFGKTHSVIQLLLILWTTSHIHIAVGKYFPNCSGSKINTSVTLVCDGIYNYDNYEDESSCNFSATYLQEGESHFISLPYTTRRRLYDATLLQTNATNGFQVVFQVLRLLLNEDLVQIGTGNDPSDIQSVITTIRGPQTFADDIYVDSNEMWFAAIGGQHVRVFRCTRMAVGVTAIDMLIFYLNPSGVNGKKMKKCFGKTHSVIQLLLILWTTSHIHIAVGKYFPNCSGSKINTSVTLVCDGIYNYDNYEDESSCNFSATYLQEGESHFISLPYTTRRRLYDATLLQTNATNGFQVVFQVLRLLLNEDLVQIGTGNDPSDIQSVITTIRGPQTFADDIYVDSNEMWFAAIGGQHVRVFRCTRMAVGVTAIDMLSDNVTFHGRLSGVFMGVRTGDGKWVT
eukprot:XP_011670121.1 PREDICTED: uncharacterized protein LOC105441059 [Strongylocentrotus purpuratus]